MNELAPITGRKQACEALGRSRASHYRTRRPRPSPGHKPRSSPRALTPAERRHVIEVLDSDEFCDLAPRQVWARLLDQGIYLCSVPMMYRLLGERGEVRERRRQARHPATVKPELMATGPCQVWSWDITKLRGPYKWTWYHLYVILDVFSRYAVGWAVAQRETARLAEDLIAECCTVEGITPGQLTLHADRGTSMTSKTVALLLADLGVTKSHSRPRVSNDNPFSESQFKTLKYAPAFPHHFTSIEHARAFIDHFFDYYNHHHRHSGLGLMTPATVHHGHADTITETRQRVLDRFHQQHPHRFRQPPQAPRPPHTVWINQPQENQPTN